MKAATEVLKKEWVAKDKGLATCRSQINLWKNM
jgi:hypothetical protein